MRYKEFKLNEAELLDSIQTKNLLNNNIKTTKSLLKRKKIFDLLLQYLLIISYINAQHNTFFVKLWITFEFYFLRKFKNL